MSSVEAAGDGEQVAERSAQLDKFELRTLEHEPRTLYGDALRSGAVN